MNEKLIKVFYGSDNLPYKDSERQVHFPIIGSAFLGASNTTEIRFYFDRIGNVETTWVSVAKLPNGKQGSKVLEIGSDEDGNYAELQLNNWYTQAKGDVFIALQGYQGGVEYELNEDDIYEIHGTPTIQTTGSIKLAINYAPIGQVADYTDEFTTYQEILAGLGDKADITSTIIVVNDITQVVATTYEDGQVFYNLADRKLYQLDNSSFVVFQPYVAISSEPIPQSDFDIILAHKEYPIIYSGYSYWYYGEDTSTLRYVRNDLNVSSNTFTTTKQQIIIFKNTRNYDVYTENAETYNKSKIDTELSGKQDTLVSGVNIATINHLSLLDNTNIDIQGGGGSAWGEITGDIQDQTDLQNEFQNIRDVAEGKTETYIISYTYSWNGAKEIAEELGVFMVYNTTTREWENKANEYISGSLDVDYEDLVADTMFNSNDNIVDLDNSYYIICEIEGGLKLLPLSFLKKGDIVLVIETDVPDRWYDGIGDFYKLETSKIDLTNYATKTELAEKSDLSNVAPEYDDTIGYVVGDKVIYNGQLYKCNTNIDTAEAFDSSKWTAISVSSAFVDLDSAQTITGVKTFSALKLDGTTLTPNGSNGFRLFNSSLRTYVKIVPYQNATVDIGENGNGFRDLYLSRNLTDGTNSVTVAELKALIDYAKSQGWIS